MSQIDDAILSNSEQRSPDVLLNIRALMPDLSSAHKRIAEMILTDPNWALQSNVEELAARSGCAKPTIVRFARSIGCEGLKDLKLKLAGTLALGTPYLHRSVQDSDAPQEVINNVVGSTLSALAEWHRAIDVDQLIYASNILNKANRIDCYGTGATSHFLAQDLQARLFRLGLFGVNYTDTYLQLVAAATLTANDVAVVISFVGRMPTLLETVAMAKSRGAKVISITRENTPLALQSDIVLKVDVPADATMPVGTDAYITQVMMIEIVSILIGQLRGPECVKRLEKIHKLLKAKEQETEKSSLVHWGWEKSDEI